MEFLIWTAGTPQKVTAWIRNHPGWIEVRPADTSLFTPQKHIQDGEREEIALAIELKDDESRI